MYKFSFVLFCFVPLVFECISFETLMTIIQQHNMEMKCKNLLTAASLILLMSDWGLFGMYYDCVQIILMLHSDLNQ